MAPFQLWPLLIMSVLRHHQLFSQILFDPDPGRLSNEFAIAPSPQARKAILLSSAATLLYAGERVADALWFNAHEVGVL